MYFHIVTSVFYLPRQKMLKIEDCEGKLIDYIIHLENKLKDRFKVLKNEEKIQKSYLIVFVQLKLRLAFYTVILKYLKQSLTTLQNFDLFYEQ